MPSFLNVALCAMAAALFWSCIGYALGRHLFSRALAVGGGPVLGWAVHSATMLGFSATDVVVAGAVWIAAAAASFLLPAAGDKDAETPAVPPWAYAAAALLALAPASAIFPKFAGDAVYLASPIFDHSKIAIIDAMARQGLPPVNPIFAAHGGPGQLAYYYLWHFSAAELALLFHASGWEADIALTWFTAFASLALMMGLAVWISKDRRAAMLVVVFAATASSRMALSWLTGADDLVPFLQDSTGFAGWLFQAAWVPQHLMAGSCVVMAMLIAAHYVQRPSAALLAALALTVVAGFESSTFVGGVSFALAAAVAAPILLAKVERGRRLRFVGAMALAAIVVACFIAPFVIDQLATIAARHDPTPVVIHPFAVLGDMFPDRLQRILDLPAYWLIELPVEFPATYLSGVIALWALWRGAVSPQRKIAIAALGCTAVGSLAGSWLFESTVGNNNDLGFRAVLPAAMVLIAATAAGIAGTSRRALIGAIALTGFILGLPNAAYLIRSNAAGTEPSDANVFAQSPQLWAAVRRVASPAARVANNPLFLQDLTPWPVNISWALLANRSSCFAGQELALAFAPLPADRRDAINDQFVRVFAGKGTAQDVSEMANTYGCDVAVVVPQDGVWNNDPFAASADYRLAEKNEGRWRIYVRNTR